MTQSVAKPIVSASRSTARRSSALFRAPLWILPLHFSPTPKSSNTGSISVHPYKDQFNPRLTPKPDDHAPRLLITTFKRLLFFRTQSALCFESDPAELKSIPITEPLLVELKDHRAARQLPQRRRRS